MYLLGYSARRPVALLVTAIACALLLAACFEDTDDADANAKALAAAKDKNGNGIDDALENAKGTSFRIGTPGNCGGSGASTEDSCVGRADGVYCSTLREFSAIKCENEQIVIGLQCPEENQKCVGPNGPGQDIECEADDDPSTDGSEGLPGSDQGAQQSRFRSKFRAAKAGLAKYAAECQGDVGLMPAFDCMNFPEIPTEQDGVKLTVSGTGKNVVIQKNGKTIPGQLTDVGNQTDQWVPQPTCDNPSWASTPCYPGTRVGLITKGDTSWAILCRRQKVQASNDPNFDLVGVIAHNKSTGATCFFDKSPLTPPLKEKDFPQPGSRDPKIETAAARTWSPPAQLENCLECHAAGPFVRSPYVKSVGVVDAMEGDGSYKILGEDLKAAWGGANAPEHLEVADSGCTDCHRLSNTGQGRLFASIATGGADIDDKRSPSTLAKNKAGQITRFPEGYWMPPDGRDTKAYPSLDDWNKDFGDAQKALQECLRNAKGKGCKTKAYSFF